MDLDKKVFYDVNNSAYGLNKCIVESKEIKEYTYQDYYNSIEAFQNKVDFLDGESINIFLPKEIILVYKYSKINQLKVFNYHPTVEV